MRYDGLVFLLRLLIFYNKVCVKVNTFLLITYSKEYKTFLRLRFAN